MSLSVLTPHVAVLQNFCLPVNMVDQRISPLPATIHVFQGVSPDVFANNRLSSALDGGKSFEEPLPRLVLIYRNELKNC
jgi:hypothetical protein